ncbi:MAG: hypothetical protein M0Z56_00965 [Desulfobacteraceae bacterium]|nr:hypothetical protein [Desulfobacteraceae bacterium]
MNDDKKNQVVEVEQNAAVSKYLTKAEVNFLVMPYFSLDKDADSNRRIEFRDMQQRGNETFEIVWTVIPHPDFGLPRDFERRLQRAVEHSLTFIPRPLSNPVPLPCIRELARMMGVNCNGGFAESVKQGLITMMMTGIMSKRSYYNKNKKAWLDEGFHLYDKIIFKGEKISGNEKADRNYAYFTSGYLDNLNAMYVRPIDFEYLKSLRPIASRLYELLGVKFYGHQDFIQYKYSTLCNLLPIRKQKTLSRSRQQLERSHKDLKRTGFIGTYGWIEIQGVKDDWYIHYVPGERFFNEITAAQQASSVGCRSLRIPVMENETGQSPDTVAEIYESGEDTRLYGFNSGPEPDALWSLFAEIVRKYPEFDLRDQDRNWLKERVQEDSGFKPVDLMYEIRNWGDWLDIQHRKKTRNEKNKFPRSNFKGSLMNWLQHSLNTFSREKTNGFVSVDQKKPGRKGFDLPSDFRVDVM